MPLPRIHRWATPQKLVLLPRAASLVLFLALSSGLMFAESPAEQLTLDPAVAPAKLGQKAHLTVDALTRKDGKFVGAYQIKVTPLGIGSEKGKITASLPEEAFTNAQQGKVVKFKGEAVNESGKTRAIEGEATPAGPNHGAVKLRITSEKGKLIFNTVYRLEETTRPAEGHSSVHDAPGNASAQAEKQGEETRYVTLLGQPNLQRARIIRGDQIIPVNLKAARTDPAADPKLQPGDIIDFTEPMW